MVLQFVYSQDNLELQKLKQNLIEARALLNTWKLSINERENEFNEREKFYQTIETNLLKRETDLLKKELTLQEREKILKENEQDYQQSLTLIIELKKSLHPKSLQK